MTNLVDGEARTDKNASISTIVNSPWIRVPYPGRVANKHAISGIEQYCYINNSAALHMVEIIFLNYCWSYNLTQTNCLHYFTSLLFLGQFGLPQFNYGLWLAFIVSAMTSVFESIGDYHAIARVSHECSPPSHAMNRGILAEGYRFFRTIQRKLLNFIFEIKIYFIILNAFLHSNIIYYCCFDLIRVINALFCWTLGFLHLKRFYRCRIVYFRLDWPRRRINHSYGEYRCNKCHTGGSISIF